jgi:acetyl/propionyl-CoA carboxylase alpha subunit
MKMQNVLKAAQHGVVAKINCKAGDILKVRLLNNLLVCFITH